MKNTDKILGVLPFYRKIRSGTWYGSGILISNGKKSKIPLERLEDDVDPTSIGIILKQKYFER